MDEQTITLASICILGGALSYSFAHGTRLKLYRIGDRIDGEYSNTLFGYARTKFIIYDIQSIQFTHHDEGDATYIVEVYSKHLDEFIQVSPYYRAKSVDDIDLVKVGKAFINDKRKKKQEVTAGSAGSFFPLIVVLLMVFLVSKCGIQLE